MTVYPSSYSALPPSAQVGVFDFLFTNNPNIDPEAVAIVDVATGASLTYRSLIRQSLQFASGLTHQAHLTPSSSVLIFSPNSIAFAISVFACQAAGLVCSTANPSYTPTELAHQLEVSQATVVLAGGDVVEVVRKACGLAGVGEGSIYVMPGVDGEEKVPKGLKGWEELRGNDGFEPIKFAPDALSETLAYLPFSSGTTGVAKGVAITHAHMTSAIQAGVINPLYAEGHSAVTIGCIPFYHAFGLTWILHKVLYLGQKIVMLPRFEMEVFLRAIEEHKVTLAPVVPPIALGLLRHPLVAKYDLSSIRYLCSGAAPLGFGLQKELQARLAAQPRHSFAHKTLVLQGWGATETTGTGFIADIRDGEATGLTIGKLMSGFEARLVEEDGKDVKEGEQGELLLRGPIVMQGYHRNAKSTAETFDEAGWMRTGDVAVRAGDGNYTIVDRRKELIKYKGLQVPPAELEAVLLGCPLVADAAVIGVYHEEQATELPRAYIVSNPAHASDADLPAKVAAYVAELVAPFKRLRGGVYLVDVVPKSPSGKILRKDLRAKAAREVDEAKAKL